MTDKIKVAIVGYGNLGKGVELAIRQNPGIFHCSEYRSKKK